MTPHRDVIADLMPVYRSGDASPATVALVETYLHDHPEFAEEMEAAQAFSLPEAPTDLKEDDEMKALTHTRFYLRLRDTLFGMAVFMSCLPFTFGSTSRRPEVHWFWDENPAIAVFLGLGALLLWGGYLWLNRKLKISNL